jgi:hypothetical protein
MKKVLLILSLVSLLSAKAQNYFNEDFNYTATQALTLNNWVQIGATTTNPISVVNTGLTYTGFTNSGVGNAAALTTTGQDVYRDLPTSVSSGNVYISFMLNLSAAQATGDYFLALLPSGSTSSFFSRFFAKSSSTGYVLGVSKWTEAAIYGSTVLSFNTTYFVVVKYSFSSTATNDDQATVYVLSSGIPTTEPTTSYVGPTAATANDQPNISRVTLRQGTAANAATLVIDGIRISGDWNSVPLPVLTKSFTVSTSNNSNLLKWTTATETNNSGFEVQRSVNNGKYEVIGFVKGAGNSRQLRNYSYTDAAELTGNVCYRLRQIDFNGNSEISKSTCVNISEEKITTEVLPTPNPFNNSLQINYATATEGNAHIEVVDMLGKVQLQTNEHVNKGANSIHLNTETLPLGIYFLRVSQGGEVLTKRIVKK